MQLMRKSENTENSNICFAPMTQRNFIQVKNFFLNAFAQVDKFEFKGSLFSMSQCYKCYGYCVMFKSTTIANNICCIFKEPIEYIGASRFREIQVEKH